MKKNKTVVFLITGIVCLLALCVLTFSYTTYRMNRQGAAAIGEIGGIYMEGMSEQAAVGFGTAIDLMLTQMGSIADSVPAERYTERAARIMLTNLALGRGFTHVALLSADGKTEMLNGLTVTADDSEGLLLAVKRGERVMAKGRDEGGSPLAIMSVPAIYPMESGGTSAALIAALPISYVGEFLSLDVEDGLIYYYIIDSEGDFVTGDRAVEDTNFFERALARYDFEGSSAEAYVEQAKTAMSAGKSWTGEFTLDGERCYQYAVSLPSSDWYLLLSMPYGELDRTVNNLGRSWRTLSISSCMVLLVLLVSVFTVYLMIMRKHMLELDKARADAENASKAKSEFLSNMSHDIRTPMNGIMGMTAIASANIDDPDQVRACLDKIDLSGKHLLNLINDILDMSKIESGKLKLHSDRMSLYETLRAVVNIVQPQTAAKSQKFSAFIYDVERDTLLGDSVRFSQILLNLLGNAVKFTPEGGSVCLECFGERSVKESFTGVRIRVKDTGIGMTEEFCKRIFDAFSREDDRRVQKTEGSGLGMAITKYIVDAMGGSIEVKSEVNKGTEFFVSVDMEVAEGETAPELREGKDVLFVSPDQRVLRSGICAAQATGRAADGAESAEEAEKAAVARAAEGRPYSAVLVDEVLCENAEETRAFTDKLKESSAAVALLSARYEKHAESAVAERGFTGTVSMPMFPSALGRELARISGGGEELAVEAARGADFAGRRVLLAEDNDLNREIAVELLSDCGLQVESAENGKICTEMFAGSAVGYYSAVLMDLRMPVMDGYEATRAIRALPRPDAPLVPIIAMSADAFSEDVKRCLECGMNAHTPKPIDMGALTALLEKFICENESSEGETK